MNICGVDLGFNFTGFQLIYTIVACFMWICSLLFSLEYMKHYENKKRYAIFMIATWFATVGVLASTNFLTTFICFEIMSFTSYVLVIHEETPNSMRAGETYLAVAVIGGMVMLMGLFLLYDAVGTLNFAELTEASKAYLSSGGTSGRLWAAGICILFGFGAKAGMFFLHIWLPKAHPIAPAPASALLSGILTKSGIFGAIVISVNVFFENISWGIMMASLGIITMFLGAVLGVFSIDLKRTLACSSVSQIGFITLGIGMICLLGEENALASNGTILHMVNHSMIKLLLFSAAGVIYMNLHKLNLNEIRGFGKKKPLLLILFLVGALSISGVPGTSGYISKTLLHESIVEYAELAKETGLESVASLFNFYEWIFLVTGGLTFCYMTKLFVCIFIEKNKDKKKQQAFDSNKSYMNKLSSLCLAAPAVVLTIMGFTPYSSMAGLAESACEFLHGFKAEHAINYYSFANLKGSLISLSIGAIVYIVIVRKIFIKKGEYKNLWPEKLDLENMVYRPFIGLLLKPGIFKYIDIIPDYLVSIIMRGCKVLFSNIDNISDCLVSIIMRGCKVLFSNIDNISDWLVSISSKIFTQYNKNSKRFSFKSWYQESYFGNLLKRIHETYLYARDTMSFGLLLSLGSLIIIMIFFIVKM